MNPPIKKYLSVALLVSLFMVKGLVSTVLPVIAGYFSRPDLQEIQMTAEAENSKEKNSEKETEKEFLHHFYTNYSSSLKYATLAKNTFPITCQSAKEVFLPISTPPPKLID